MHVKRVSQLRFSLTVRVEIKEWNTEVNMYEGKAISYVAM